MTQEQKKWIDEATYENLLAKWRFAPAGDTMFVGDTGDYYVKVMHEKKEKLEDGEHVRVSKKKLGW